MARLKTLTDSFSIVEGVVVDSPANIGAFEQAAVIPDRRGRGNLYVLVELVGALPDPSVVQRELMDVAREYLASVGSITAGIRSAIKNANAYLYERNLKAEGDQRCIAGITVMVLKDRDAYLGQLGPALAYQVGASGVVRRLPADSGWLSSESLEDIDPKLNPPLGMRSEVEPDLSHLRLEQGDTLLLASTMISRVVAEDALSKAVKGKDSTAARDDLQHLCKGSDVSALVVKVTGVGDIGSAFAEELAPAADRENGAGVAQKAGGLWTRISSGLKETLDSRQTAEATGEVAVELISEETAGPTEDHEIESPRPAARLSLQPLVNGLKKAAAGAGRAGRGLLERVLPAEQGIGAHKTGTHRASEMLPVGERRWIYLALIIPVLVLASYGVSRWQYDRSQQSQIRILASQAEDAKIAAQHSTSPAEQRAKLTEALAALDQALKLNPKDVALSEERKAVSLFLDQVSGTVRFAAFNVLNEFADTEAAKCQLTTVIVRGSDVWTLDVGLDRVYKHLLDDSQQALRTTEVEPVVVRKGDQHGGMAVDELLDVVWVDSGTQPGVGSVFIIDRKGQVLEYDDATGIRRFATADVSAWRNPVAVAGYLLNRFYVLDGSTNRILRYQLNAAGYEGAPSDYASTAGTSAISGGIDLAIDGDVYVLQADGRIVKYHQGSPVAFPQKGLDIPLSSPSSIFVTGSMDEGGSVYVADTGNSRIVKFSKVGEFVRQYRSVEPGNMDSLRGLFVDEDNKRVYLINGNRLLQASLAGQ